MLEARVTRLETDFREMKASLRAIETAVADIKHLPKTSDVTALSKEIHSLAKDIAEVKGKLSNMPTTWTLIAFAVGAVLASGGLAFTIARLVFKP